MSRLLVHACCAPCLAYVYNDVNENYKNFDVLWYNPNIQPKEEYDLRLNTLIEFLALKDRQPIILDEYNLYDFTKNATNLGQFSSRCEYCYTKRLEKVFEYAKQNNYTHVTTTLLISPYQKHDLICEICNKLAKQYNVIFAYKDYRVHFREGQAIAKDLGLYRQKYCGCIYSLDEAFIQKKSKK